MDFLFAAALIATPAQVETPPLDRIFPGAPEQQQVQPQRPPQSDRQGQSDRREQNRERMQQMPRRSRLLMALDIDGDGSLSAEEIDMAVASLRKLDANQDGTLSAEELTGTSENKQQPEEQRRTRTQGEKQGQSDGPSRLLTDHNGDGKVTADDLQWRIRDHFTRMDTDGNGELSQAEIEAAKARFRERQQQGGQNQPGQGQQQRQQRGPEGQDDRRDGPVQPERPPTE